jgi:hypothetical protein
VKLRLTPDGKRYLAMAKGLRQPVPFHLRWLLPTLCSDFPGLWFATNLLALVALPLLTVLLALQHGATQTQALAAGALLAGLPFMRFAWRYPILVDMPALAFALGAAVVWPTSHIFAYTLVFFAGATSEKAPIWAAIFALQPLLLVGLAVPIIRRIFWKPAPIDPKDPLAWTFHPFEAGQRGHKERWREPYLMLTPWGACLVLLVSPSFWPLLALAFGYGLLLVATDSVRLYQQAAPAVCVSAALLIPEPWLLPVLAGHWFNPWMGDGL